MTQSGLLSPARSATCGIASQRHYGTPVPGVSEPHKCRFLFPGEALGFDQPELASSGAVIEAGSIFGFSGFSGDGLGGGFASCGAIERPNHAASFALSGADRALGAMAGAILHR